MDIQTTRETPNGKIVRATPENGLWRIDFTSGGELPKSLQGRYTSLSLALKAIDKYIEDKTKELATKVATSKATKKDTTASEE